MVRRMGRSSTKIENNFIYKILFIRSKWLRRLVKLIFAILFIICINKYYLQNWTFLEIDDDKVPLKILIPNKIVKEKDCVEFYDWQSSNIPEDKRQTCPWEKKR
jgi:type II secretory pathway component PulF